MKTAKTRSSRKDLTQVQPYSESDALIDLLSNAGLSSLYALDTIPRETQEFMDQQVSKLSEDLPSYSTAIASLGMIPTIGSELISPFALLKAPKAISKAGSLQKALQKALKPSYPNVIKDEMGSPLKVFHGGKTKIDIPDPSLSKINANFGQGQFYTTPDIKAATDFARLAGRGEGPGEISEFFLKEQPVFDFTQPATSKSIEDFGKMLNASKDDISLVKKLTTASEKYEPQNMKHVYDKFTVALAEDSIDATKTKLDEAVASPIFKNYINQGQGTLEYVSKNPNTFLPVDKYSAKKPSITDALLKAFNKTSLKDERGVIIPKSNVNDLTTSMEQFGKSSEADRIDDYINRLSESDAKSSYNKYKDNLQDIQENYIENFVDQNPVAMSASQTKTVMDIILDDVKQGLDIDDDKIDMLKSFRSEMEKSLENALPLQNENQYKALQDLEDFINVLEQK